MPTSTCRPLLLALLGLAALACDSVVPAEVDFAAGRCQTVLADGVEGMPTFELGAIFQLTKPDGTPEPTGQYALDAMRLAIQELNDRDIAGKRFRLRVCDTRADWSTGGGQATRDLATWLVDQGVQAILSDASTDTQTIQAVTVPKGVLVMAISATSVDLTHLPDQGLVWRVAPSDVYQAAVLAHLATETTAADSKVAVLAVQTPYGDGLVASLGKLLGARLTQHTFESDGTGLDVAVAAAAQDAPATLVVVGNPPAAVQIANLRAKHPELATAKLLFADGACDGDVAKQPLDAGVSLADVRCARPGQPPTNVYKVFRERYTKKFAVDPADYSYTQHAFDATYSVALAHAWALGQAGSGQVDGKSLAEGLEHMSAGAPHAFSPAEITAMIAALGKGEGIDVEGASGQLDFNPDTGEAPSDYEVWTLGAKGELQANQFYAVEDLGAGQYSVAPVAKGP